MVREGGTAPCPPHGDSTLWRAGCDVIPVYRDWRQFPKGKSRADLNLKQAKKREVGAVAASTLW